jgi:hypothetical protein
MNMNAILEMPVRLEPGEIMLYLDLHRIENMSAIAALKLAQDLGFNPELRYRYTDQEGDREFGLCAILHREQRPYDSALEIDYVTDPAFETLATEIKPNTAVHFWYRLKHGRLIPAELVA